MSGGGSSCAHVREVGRAGARRVLEGGVRRGRGAAQEASVAVWHLDSVPAGAGSPAVT